MKQDVVDMHWLPSENFPDKLVQRNVVTAREGVDERCPRSRRRSRNDSAANCNPALQPSVRSSNAAPSSEESGTSIPSVKIRTWLPLPL